MSSIISKSAKTTERRAKRVKTEGHSTRPERKPVHAMPNKTRMTASKVSRPKVDASANTLSDDLMKPGARESSLPSSFKIIAGSYERLLYGLQATVSVSSPATSSELEWTLKPIFIFPAHVSYIKTVAASPQGGKWLATGSGDEIIKVWDLRRRKEVGGLMQHEGSTTHFSISLREPTFFWL
jgi:protein MAK11